MCKVLTVSILQKRDRKNVMSEKASDSEERLNFHPILKERFELLPDMIEDTGGDYDNPSSMSCCNNKNQILFVSDSGGVLSRI